MTRPATKGFQKPLDSGKRRNVKMAIIRTATVNGVTVAECSCGKPFTQQREKVREDAIDRHLARSHSGRGIRL